MKKQIPNFETMPVLCACSSTNSINDLVEASKRTSNNKEFVLLMDYGERYAGRVLPAFINARIRIGDGIARSKSMQMEMLLLICGTMKIGKALEECGAKSPERFLLFSTKEPLLKKFAKTNGIKILEKVKLNLDPKVSGNVAMTEFLSE